MDELRSRPATSKYNREKAVEYAHKWAMKRNSLYLDFEKYGGDCTNFASQVIYAGCGIMNYTPVHGWYYLNSRNRSPAWTDVDILYKFLIRNKGMGPYAQEVDVKDVRPGDIIQLSFHGGGDYNHSPIIVQTGIIPRIDNILIASHTIDRDYYPLTSYNWVDIRFVHIIEARGV